MIKIIIVLLLSTIISFLSNSCCKSYSYRWSYIISQNLNNNSVTTQDSISKENYGIKVNFVSQKFAFNNPFLQEIYATSCGEYYTNLDSITDIKLITIYDFDESEPEESNVIDYFSWSSDSSLSLAEFIHDINSNDRREIDNFKLILNYEPPADSIYQFRVEIELSDSRLLTSTTPEVVLY